MRQGQHKNRSRGRGGRRQGNALNRVFESNGPDVKVRGTAQHVAEKYLQLGRDAQASGDLVMAESYYQHAEHYLRILAAVQAANPSPQFQPPLRGRPGDDMMDGDEDGYDTDEALLPAGSGPQPALTDADMEQPASAQSGYQPDEEQPQHHQRPSYRDAREGGRDREGGRYGRDSRDRDGDNRFRRPARDEDQRPRRDDEQRPRRDEDQRPRRDDEQRMRRDDERPKRDEDQRPRRDDDQRPPRRDEDYRSRRPRAATASEDQPRPAYREPEPQPPEGGEQPAAGGEGAWSGHQPDFLRRATAGTNGTTRPRRERRTADRSAASETAAAAPAESAPEPTQPDEPEPAGDANAA